MPHMLVIVLGVFGAVAAISIFVEGKPQNKLWGIPVLLIPIALWTWVGIAAHTPNTIQSVKTYNIDTLSDGAQVVAVSDDGSRLVNLNVEMGRNIPSGLKAKRTVWNGVYMGIDFKMDATRGSLKDTWELVKE